MRAWIHIIFWLYSSTLIHCGEYEDATDLLSSFKSVVDLPLSQDFKKAHRFISFTSSFIKKAVPFGELFATALKVGLEEDQLDSLLTLTNGIDAKVKDVAKQQQYLLDSTLYRDLFLEFDEKVDQRVTYFLNQIRFMSSLKMNVSQQVTTTFVHNCNSVNSPAVIAEYLSSKLVNRCTSPHPTPETTAQIFNAISSLKYREYSLTAEEKQLFYESFAVVSFWMSHRTKSSVLEKFVNERSSVYLHNKVRMLDFLMEELGIEDKRKLDTLCLPKAAFVAHGFKRDSIERFGDVLMEQITSLEYITLMCANITFYGDAEKAEKYTLNVGQLLEPVYNFVTTWFDALLNSTWPATEIFRRQNVLTRARRSGVLSTDFALGCRPGVCANETSMNARLIAIRTRVDTNEAYESLQTLLEFRNYSSPIFQKAMDTQFYNYNFVSRVIELMAAHYDLDFTKYKNHSSYIVLREDKYLSGCSNAYSLKCTTDLDNNFLQTLHYHTDGSKVTDCEDWLVILGF